MTRPDGRGWDLVATRFADMGELAEYAASFGPDVVVLDPPDLREAVIAKLKAAKLKARPEMPRPAKPRGAAPGGAQARRHVDMPDDDGVEEVARAIGAVLAAGRRVHLRHYSPKTDTVTERDVDPIGLIVDNGRPYLHGWCLLREERRFFRLDRVLALEVLDVPASPPAEAEHVNFARACSGPHTTTSAWNSSCPPRALGGGVLPVRVGVPN